MIFFTFRAKNAFFCSRFPANESPRRTGLHWSISVKSSFYLPAFEISRSCPPPLLVSQTFLSFLLLLVSLLLLTLLWSISLLFNILLYLFPPVPASLLLASSNVPVVYCTAYRPSVCVVLSAVNLPGAPAVRGVPTVVNIPSFTDVLVLASLLLLTFLLFPLSLVHLSALLFG